MKARVLHVSDTHIKSGSRADEISTLLESVGQEARKAKVDLIVHSGDVFDAASDPIEREIFAEALTLWSEVAPVVVIRGNHDRADDLMIFRRTGRPWKVENGSAWKGEGLYPVMVAERSEQFEIGDCSVFALPWFTKAHIAATVEAAANDTESLGGKLTAAARGLLTAIRQQVSASDRIPILVGHVLIGGSVVSTGQTLIGTTVEVSPHDLADTGAACMLGHIHKAQEWADGRVAYAGSPWRQNFGETEEKGFRLIEIERNGSGLTLNAEFVKLPAREIQLIDLDFTNLATRKAFLEDPMSVIKPHVEAARDALVRVRYTIGSDNADSINHTDVERILANAGAFESRVEPVVRNTAKTRAPEIITQTAPEDKLSTWLESQSIRLPAEERAALDVYLSEIEGESIESDANESSIGGVHLSRLKFRGLTRFTDEEPIDINFGALGPGLISLVGETGAGKSTAMEATAVALGYGFATRPGSLYPSTHGKDAFVQAEFGTENGDTIQGRVLIDGSAEKTEGYLTMNGKPLVEGKITDYRAATAHLFGSSEFFFAGPFATQDKSGSILTLPKGERKKLFVEMLPELKRFENLSEASKQKRISLEFALKSKNDQLSGLLPLVSQLDAVGASLSDAQKTLEVQLSEAERTESLKVEAQRALDAAAAAGMDLQRLTVAYANADRELTTANNAYHVARRHAEEQRTSFGSRISREEEALANLGEERLRARHQREEASFTERERKLILLADDADIIEADAALTGVEEELARIKEIQKRRTTIEASLVTARSTLASAESKLGLAETRHEEQKRAAERRAAFLGTVPCAAQPEWPSAAGESVPLVSICPAIKDARAAQGELVQLSNATYVAESAAYDFAKREVVTLQGKLSLLIVDTARLATLEQSLRRWTSVAGRRVTVEQAKRDLVSLAEERELWSGNAEGELSSLAQSRHSAELALANLKALSESELESAQATLRILEADIQTATQVAEEARVALETARSAAPDEKGLQDKVFLATKVLREAESRVRDWENAIAGLQAKVEMIREAEVVASGLRSEAASIALTIEQWTLLERAFGKDGIQALEIDASGPEIARLTSELLEACFGPRFSVAFETLRALKSKKGAFSEAFDIKVYDRGVERAVERLSGGEKAIVGEALSLAIAIFNSRKGGVRWRTLWRDETAGSLDPHTADQYVMMLRKALAIGDFYQVLFVAHSPAVYQSADVQLYVADGKITVGEANYKA